MMRRLKSPVLLFESVWWWRRWLEAAGAGIADGVESEIIVAKYRLLISSIIDIRPVLASVASKKVKAVARRRNHVRRDSNGS